MKILNIKNLDPSGLKAVEIFCEERIRSCKGAFLIPMNPIKVIKARSRPDFQQIIDGADWVFPDAWGMKWAASVLYGRKIDIIPGYHLMLHLMRRAETAGRAVYILGTTDAVLRKAAERIKAMYPGLKIVGMHNGFFSEKMENDIFRDIAVRLPDYVFVAMGEYKQEKVIEKLRNRYPSAVYLGVGGSIDLVAGVQPTPPAWMRTHHLEWLFRLVRQPFRLPRFKALPIMVVLVLIEKIKSHL